MAFEDENQFEDSDAAGMRKQLGKLGRDNKSMSERLARYEAQDLISTKGYTEVKPEELVGVAEDQREETAKKLHEERRGQKESLLREVYGEMYEDEEQIEEAVAAHLSGTKVREDHSTEEQVSRARTLGHQDAQRTPAVDPRKLQGEDAIAHALSQPNRRNK